MEWFNQLFNWSAQQETADEDGWTPLHYASRNGHLKLVKEMIKQGAQVETANNNGNTPLYIASQNNHLEVVKLLIKESAQVENANKDGWTALHIAFQNGHLKVVKELIKQGAQVENADKDGWTPLHIASQNGHLKVVKELIKQGAQVENADKDGWTPLHIASQNGHLEVVKELIKQGAQVETANNNGITPLNIASQNGHLKVVKKLINQGAQVKNANKDGWTALNIASQNGHLEVVKELIKQGAQVETANNNGITPLHIASHKGHLEVVKELINQGAQVENANKDGWTALNIASQNGHLEVVKELIKQGAQVETANNNGITPLNIASQNGHLKVVKELINQGAQVENANKDGWTALNIASQNGHLEVVKELIKQGAQIETANNNGITPLHIASHKGHLEVVKELINQGAQVENADKNGYTALHIASHKGHLEVVKELIKQGADIMSTTNNLFTPLHASIKSGHLLVVKELLKEGAVITACTKQNYTPLHRASELGETEIVKLLIEFDAEINAASSDGWTPLMIAVNKSHEEITNLLLNSDANITSRNKFGMTALILAAGHKQTTIATKLLEKGAKVDDSNLKGWTSLMIAAENGNDAMVQMLINYKADVNLRNTLGKSALMLANEKKHKKVVELLITNRAVKYEIVEEKHVQSSQDETINKKIVLKNNYTPCKQNATEWQQEEIWNIITLSRKGKIENITSALSTYDINTKDIILSISLKYIREYSMPIAIEDDLNYELLKIRLTNDKANVGKSNKSITIKGSDKSKHLDEILKWNQPVNQILLYHIKKAIFYLNDLMFDNQYKKKLPWQKLIFFFQQYIHYFTIEYSLNILHVGYITTKNLKWFVYLIKNVILQKNERKLKENVEDSVEHLNNLYDTIRDVYTLNRIEKYIQLWKNEYNTEKHYWSTLRLLQVIGESFKTTHASPNVSKELLNSFKHYYIDNDLIQIRNFLSHLTGIPELPSEDVSIIIKDTETIVSIFKDIKKYHIWYLINKQSQFKLKNNFELPPYLEYHDFVRQLRSILTSTISTVEINYANPFFKYIDLSSRIISNYDECLQILKNALESNNILQIEYLLLVVLNNLKEKKKTLNINRTWFREKYPTLTGAQLRNHLAHGDTIVQLLNIDEEMAVKDTAKLLTENLLTIFTEKPTKRPTDEEENINVEEDLERLNEKQRLFDLIIEGNLIQLKEYLDTFNEQTQEIWIHWCNHRRENILQQAAQNKKDNLELFKFIYEKHPSLIEREYKINRGIDDLAVSSGNNVILKYVNQLIEEYSLAPLFPKQ